MSRPDTSTPRSVHTKSGVFVLGKNEHVLAGGIETISAAPLGRYALLVQKLRPPVTPENKRPYGEEKLWLYDALRRTTTLLHRVTDDPATRAQTKLTITWFPKTNRALIRSDRIASRRESPLHDVRTSYGLVDTERKHFRPLSTPFENWEASIAIEEVPENDLLLFISDYSRSKPATKTVTFLSPDGRFAPLVSLGRPPNKSSLIFEGILHASQEVIFQDWYEDLDKPDEPGNATWYALRINGKELRSLPEKPKNIVDAWGIFHANPPTPGPLILEEESTKLKNMSGGEVETTALWLRATEPGPDKKKAQALVAVAPYLPVEITSESTDIDFFLLTDPFAVLYLHEGDLYATALTRKP